MSKVQSKLITIALRGVTVLPQMRMYLDMIRPMSIAAAANAQKTGQRVFLVTQKDPDIENPTEEQLEEYGVIANVRQIIKGTDKGARVLVSGIRVAKLNHIEEYVPNLLAEVTIPDEEDGNDQDEMPPEEKKEREYCRKAALRVLQDLTREYCDLRQKACKEISALLEAKSSLDSFSALLACNLPWPQALRQKYLELYTNVDERAAFLVHWMEEEIQIEAYRKEIQGTLQRELEKQQKEHILREQMKLIRKELGESAESNADQYEAQLQRLEAPAEVITQIQKEIKKLRSLHYGGPEVSVCQNYIETLLALPWQKRTREQININKARKILNAQHYGMEKVKEHVLEFLAVRKMQEKNNGSTAKNSSSHNLSKGRILCLVGPPGTGKTSIARSIAEAMNRRYVRISLGGVHDEAEIRGHRRTYVAAMPGRIIQAIRKAEVCNPLILLDELDKMGRDGNHGDVAAAMLEVLDAEQNHAFADHYLEVPFNLSEVLFVATANTLDTIPRPLLDRMDVIEVNSYTAAEKYQIAKKYLLGKQQETAGLPKGLLKIDKAALERIISGYTRESGVRNLERQIGAICRKAALEHLEQEKEVIHVTADNLSGYLGKEKYRPESVLKRGEIGIVRGLAWTSVGGVTLEVEVNVTSGNGALRLTGQLGDVMKESAQAALSYVKTAAAQYGVEKEYFEQHDIHIHIPQGAVPKDGPSAGITMATALLSAVIQKPVRPDVAMTGEITLRGRVLAIGGLREKLLAAKAAGAHLVFIPEENQADLEELETEVTEKLEIRPVRHMDEVVKEAISE